MNEQHPVYRGPVIDGHCHFDESTVGHAQKTLESVGLSAAVHFWNVDWPPPTYAAEGEAFGKHRGALYRCHVPDLSDIGASGSEERMEGALREAAAEGAVAVKLWKNLGLWLTDDDGRLLAVDDARLSVIWETAASCDLPIVIHIGDAAGFFAPLDDENPRIKELEMRPDFWFGGPEFPELAEIHAQFERVVAGHPKTRFVGLHFGCFMDWDDVDRMLAAYPNYFVDTATRVAELGHTDAWETVRDMIVRHGDRVIFGTDLIRTRVNDLPGKDLGWEVDPSPRRWDVSEFYARHWSFFETLEPELDHPLPFQGDWKVHGLGLPEDVLRRLYFDNAARIFSLDLGSDLT